MSFTCVIKRPGDSEWQNVKREVGLYAPRHLGSGMKPKVRARAPELSPEPEYLNFRFFQNYNLDFVFIYIIGLNSNKSNKEW